MAIRVALTHRTDYRYDRLVALSPHVVRLRPAPHCRTPIEAYSLRISPAAHFISWQQDPFGNFLARVVFPERTDALSIVTDLIADMTVINPFDFFLDDEANHYPFPYGEQLARELAPYLEIKERGTRLLDWTAQVSRARTPTVEFLVELNRRLRNDIAYTIRLDPGVQSCEQTLQLALGSCRDSSWLLVQILRHLGLAARFVSGYLVQLVADVEALDGPSGPQQDFTDLHAWAEVYVPGAGWIGLDPTSGLLAGEGHIPLACTPDPLTAAPITGSCDTADVRFSYANQVTRIREDPRVTKPYTEEQWAAIDRLGLAVDHDLAEQDVRLTMGGEPTFVSIDDMEGEEWNTAASGPAKRRLAGDLLQRLQRRFAPGSVLLHGQGKWYPGEALPRWALGCYWRADGQPVWRNPELLATESGTHGVAINEAQRFVHRLAEKLGLPVEAVVPGHEDVFYYLWKEGILPVDVDPLRADLHDPLERQRLARLLNHGLGSITGFALPLRWATSADGTETWQTTQWRFRRRRMYLLPGDSPMGYRLPLESLPAPPSESDTFERPLLVQLPPFGDRRLQPNSSIRQASPDATVAPGIRTAICVEPRERALFLFMPPLTQAEHWIDLIAAVEETAAELAMPVFLEGYEPPPDYRLQSFRITPDPGVIEVNIHPARSWEEVRDHTTTLYEEAREARLGTEKFMLDGRHTGTGGGNHVTLGGPTPLDSPFLRRPDLLRSLITFWQNHPSLSYLFSGLFVGPTSQAPRVDEARDDSLYELEIAFQRFPAGEVSQPWLVDRLLRNLLVDVTGNTHRTELCIDKLHSPETQSGRLGLVELRAFEMPPHPRMSCVQQLLLRVLVAHFWKSPFAGELTRWGTALHDRFLLPHFVWEDFRDVICDLRGAGYPLELGWFAPFFEFRFPPHGRVNLREIELELRLAVEPWHVLGEEATSSGTARYVDSSVERLQVRASGMTPGRWVVACNGRRVPLQSTGIPGEYVAGVRYRAWQAPSALHPTIAVHTPLVFDLIDCWNGRSLGGCTYHVAHPGGRNYEQFPVNANEAEGRRVARFSPHGHSPGPMPIPVAEWNPTFPCTLDLRYRNPCG